MIKNLAVKLVTLFFVSLILFGCALSLPQPYLTEPTQMKAQIANYQVPKLPEDRKAIVYIVRPSPYDPHGFNVFLDTQEPNAEMGYTMPKRYIYFDLTPGEHKIFSKAENWAEINVSAKAGDIIFIQQEPTMGVLRPKNKLLILHDDEGKYYVKTLTRGTFSSNNQQNLQTASTASASASVMPVGSGNILGINVGPTSGPRGVTVITVVPGSPCASVLKPGDRIFTFDLIDQNGSRVGHQRKINANNFQEEVSKIQPGMTVKMSLGHFKYVNCTIPANVRNLNQPNVQTVTTQARLEQSGKADTYKGIITNARINKGFGFGFGLSSFNLRIEVTADNGSKDIFYLRPDSKVFDVSGNQVDWTKIREIQGKKVEIIESFTIADKHGGNPSSSRDFSSLIGQKGVRVMRFVD
ncbi:MAG: hypothetical protein A2031_07130 [Deltaproteobacteria bacterium RBG_19FT_COMBO_43_11]|nr:MAG: hypothetical protein A2031_07130 [Deltaproteobacteria bacterium RBG_19FT_COMBO_43_11]